MTTRTIAYAAFVSARDSLERLEVAYAAFPFVVSDAVDVDYGARHEAQDAANAAWDVYYDTKTAWESMTLGAYAGVMAEAEELTRNLAISHGI